MQQPIVTVVTAPNALDLISVERARLHCRIAGMSLDVAVTDAIHTARAWVQERTRRAIGAQRLALAYPAWCGSAELPFDVTTLVDVTVDGVVINPLPAIVDGALELEAFGRVVITIDTGYTAETLPAPIKAAMLLIVADQVRNLGSQVEAQLYENQALDNLLYPFIRSWPV